MLNQRPSMQDVVVPLLVIAAAFIIYFEGYSLSTGVFLSGVAVLAFTAREIGQRTVAQWMDAYVETKLSREGSVLTLFVSFISVITALPVIWLLPSINSFSQEKHEHWGKSVDAMWSKREHWIALGGITTLTMVSIISYTFSQLQVVQAVTVYTLSQMVPLRDIIIEGNTDGTYILFHSGFMWLTFTGFNIMLLTVAVF